MKWFWVLAAGFAGVFCCMGSASHKYESLWKGPSVVQKWDGLWSAPQALSLSSATPAASAPRWVGYFKKDGELYFRLVLSGKPITLKEGQSDGPWTLAAVELKNNRPVRLTLTNPKSWTLTLEK